MITFSLWSHENPIRIGFYVNQALLQFYNCLLQSPFFNSDTKLAGSFNGSKMAGSCRKPGRERRENRNVFRSWNHRRCSFAHKIKRHLHVFCCFYSQVAVRLKPTTVPESCVEAKSVSPDPSHVGVIFFTSQMVSKRVLDKQKLRHACMKACSFKILQWSFWIIVSPTRWCPIVS